MNELFVVPLGQGRFSTIVVRDGTVTLDQVRNLVGADGLGLQLIPVPSVPPEIMQPPTSPTLEQENNDGS